MSKWLAIGICLLSLTSKSQRRDSILAYTTLSRDTFYIITENRPKYTLLGNLWYVSAEYNWSRSNEFKACIGRSYGRTFSSGAGFGLFAGTWGAGYSLFYRHKVQNQAVTVFYEYSAFPLPPACWRAEYMYDITNGAHYIRPAFGISLAVLDIQYNYSFLLSGEENQFRHGVSFRLKYAFPRNKWQVTYPSRC